MTGSASTRNELGRFLIVGVMTVGIDYLSYRLALMLGGQVGWAKAGGFICGSVFAYFANRLWTFSARQVASGSFWRFAAVYGINLGVNVALNAAVLAIFSGFGPAFALAFFVATGASAALNFVGMRYFVFAATTATGERV